MSHETSQIPPDCRDVRPELSACLDGELSPADAARVERHLSECPACRDELAALRRLRDALGTLPRARVPFDLAGDARRGLLRARAAPAAAARSAGRLRAVAGLRIAAAAALIVLGVTLTWRVLERPPAVVPAGTPAAPEPRIAASEGGDGAHVEYDTGKPPEADGVVDRAIEPAGAPLAAVGYERLPADAPPEAPAVGVVAPPEPVVDVVVTPQSLVEYTSALELLREATLAYGPPTGAPSGQFPTERAAGARLRGLAAPAAPATETRFEFQVPPERVWSVINTLESSAPRQIAVAMNFRGHDAAQFQQVDGFIDHDGSGGGATRGRAPTDARLPALSARATYEGAAARDEVSARPGAREAPAPESVEQTGRADAAVAEGGRGLGGAGGAGSGLAERLGAPTSQEARTDDRTTEERRFGAQWRLARRGGLDELSAAMLPTQPASQPAASQAVTFRVRIAPPPAEPAPGPPPEERRPVRDGESGGPR